MFRSAAVHPSAHPFGRFAVSSVVSAGVDLASFELFCRLTEQVLGERAAIVAATCAARVLSSLVNYLINYFLVFHSRASYGRSAGLYTVITAAKTLCSALAVAAAAPLLPAVPRVGLKACADTLLFFVNYLLQKAFVY